MRWSFEIERIEDARFLVRLLSVLSGGLLLVSVCLSVVLVLSDQTWILIPQYGIDHRVTVRRSGWAQAYLIDWAESILSNALTLSPETVDRKHADLLRISSAGNRELRSYLVCEATKIKKNRMDTVFYPKAFDVDEAKSHVRVEVELLVYLGRDKTPITCTKVYLVSYEQGSHGLILLTSLKEETAECP